MPRPPRGEGPPARFRAGGLFNISGSDALHAFAVFDTAHGPVALGWRDARVTALRLPGDSAEATRAALLRLLPGAQEAKPNGPIVKTVAAIKRYFDGAAEEFADVAVDLGRQEPFFARVYEHVRALRYGETSSYGEIARALHATPEAARTVGQAMARNPIPLIVPCHRVMAAGGRIGGFSAPGGSDTKLRMLELERAIEPPAQHGFNF